MHANLRTTLAAATLLAAVPAAGVANANGDHHAGGHKNKPAKRCDRGGRGYEAAGRLADGSELVQVAGGDTARRSDDRYSGTLVVQVSRGNKRGRQDKGLTSFTVTSVRALGTVAGDDPLPPVGTRVNLVGRAAKPSCAPVNTGTTPPPTTPSETATPASRLHRDEDAPPPPTDGADAAGDDEAPTALASTATIRLVVFKPSRDQKAAGGLDDPAVDDPAGDDDDHAGDGGKVADRGSADDAPSDAADPSVGDSDGSDDDA